MNSALMLLSATNLAQLRREDGDADGDIDGDLGGVLYAADTSKPLHVGEMFLARL